MGLFKPPMALGWKLQTKYPFEHPMCEFHVWPRLWVCYKNGGNRHIISHKTSSKHINSESPINFRLSFVGRGFLGRAGTLFFTQSTSPKTNMALEKSTTWRCISYWEWGFSMAMLVFLWEGQSSSPPTLPTLPTSRARWIDIWPERSKPTS